MIVDAIINAETADSYRRAKIHVHRPDMSHFYWRDATSIERLSKRAKDIGGKIQALHLQGEVLRRKQDAIERAKRDEERVGAICLVMTYSPTAWNFVTETDFVTSIKFGNQAAEGVQPQ